MRYSFSAFCTVSALVALPMAGAEGQDFNLERELASVDERQLSAFSVEEQLAQVLDQVEGRRNLKKK